MNLIVTNNHHFSKGVTLRINDNKLTWEIDREKQKYKYGTGVFGKKASDNDGILDPENSLDDFIALLQLIFEFTGCGTHYIKIESNDNTNANIISVWDVIKLIYNTPLEHDVRFVRFGTCGCNMGHCGEITGINIDDTRYTTYGDIMKLFSMEYEGEESEEN